MNPFERIHRQRTNEKFLENIERKSKHCNNAVNIVHTVQFTISLDFSKSGSSSHLSQWLVFFFILGILSRIGSLPILQQSFLVWHAFHFQNDDSHRLSEVNLSCPRISSMNMSSFSGLRRSIRCVYHAHHARQYVREHELLLDRAAHHGGIGIALPEQSKNGIPHGCGFDFPIQSVMFIFVLLLLLLYSIVIP